MPIRIWKSETCAIRGYLFCHKWWRKYFLIIIVWFTFPLKSPILAPASDHKPSSEQAPSCLSESRQQSLHQPGGDSHETPRRSDPCRSVVPPCASSLQRSRLTQTTSAIGNSGECQIRKNKLMIDPYYQANFKYEWSHKHEWWAQSVKACKRKSLRVRSLFTYICLWFWKSYSAIWGVPYGFIFTFLIWSKSWSTIILVNLNLVGV